MFTIKTNFPRRMGLPSSTKQEASLIPRKLVTRRVMQDYWNAVGTTLLLRLSKKQSMFVQSTLSHDYILIFPQSVLHTPVHYRACTTAIMNNLLPQRTDAQWQFWDKPSPTASKFVIPEQSNLLCSLKELKTRRATPSVTTRLNE
jgi:hypothetical protein